MFHPVKRVDNRTWNSYTLIMTEEELYKMVLQFKPWAKRAARNLDCEGMDILHDVYLKISRWATNNPLESEVRGLIATFMDRHIKDLGRADNARKRREEAYHENVTLPSLERDAYDPADYFDNDVADVLRKLPWKYHETILLRDKCGLSYEEMGRILSLPTGTISSRIYRARKMLAKALDKIRGEEVN